MNIYFKPRLYDFLQSAVLKSFKAAAPAYRAANIFAFAQGLKMPPTFFIPPVSTKSAAPTEESHTALSASTVGNSFNQSGALNSKLFSSFPKAVFTKNKTDALATNELFNEKKRKAFSEKSFIPFEKRENTVSKAPLSPRLTDSVPFMRFIPAVQKNKNFLAKDFLFLNANVYHAPLNNVRFHSVLIDRLNGRYSANRLSSCFPTKLVKTIFPVEPYIENREKNSHSAVLNQTHSPLIMNAVHTAADKRYGVPKTELLLQNRFFSPPSSPNFLTNKPKAFDKAYKNEYEKIGRSGKISADSFSGFKKESYPDSRERDLKEKKKPAYKSPQTESAPKRNALSAYNLDFQMTLFPFWKTNAVFSENFYPFMIENSAFYKNNLSFLSAAMLETKEIASDETSVDKKRDARLKQNKAPTFIEIKKREKNNTEPHPERDSAQDDFIEGLISALTEALTETAAISTESYYD